MTNYVIVLQALRDKNTGTLHYPSSSNYNLQNFYWFTVSNEFPTEMSKKSKIIFITTVENVDLSEINNIVIEATKKAWDDKKTLEEIISRAIKQAKS
ncbi:MAG: hypothetical protein QXE93_02600 [Candidatus Pacearchaeota archaeon]